MLIGNPKYMSPEQLGLLGDGEQVDGRADLYCLGVVLYEMLLGVPPFASETPHGYIMKHLTADAAALRRREAEPRGAGRRGERDLPRARKRPHEALRERARVCGRARAVPRGAGGDAHARGRRPRAPRTRGTSSVVPTRRSDGRGRASVCRSNTRRESGRSSSTLLDDVHERESNGDRDGLQRLAEAHPPRIRGRRRSAQSAPSRRRCGGVGGGSRARVPARVGGRAQLRVARVPRASSRLAARGGSAAAGARRRRRSRPRASSESETAVRQFLMAWPDARHHLEAGILLAKLKQRAAEARAYEDARRRNTPSGWRLYLTAYPSGAHAEEAASSWPIWKRRRSPRSCIAAESRGGVPHQLRRLSAPRRSGPPDRAVASGRESSPRARRLGKAWESGGARRGTAISRNIPNRRAPPRRASCRQEALDFELAIATNKPAMWRAFIKAWPGGRHRMEAEIRMRKRTEPLTWSGVGSRRWRSAEAQPPRRRAARGPVAGFLPDCQLRTASRRGSFHDTAATSRTSFSLASRRPTLNMRGWHYIGRVRCPERGIDDVRRRPHRIRGEGQDRKAAGSLR